MPDNINTKPEGENTENQEPHGPIIDTSVFLVDVTKGLKKFWYIVLIIAIFCGLGSFYYRSSTYVPMYQASVSFSVSTATYSSGIGSVASSYYDSSSAAQMSKTFPYIINTSMMVNALKNELGVSYINGAITAEAVASDSNIFKVTVTSSSAQSAYDIVNAVIKVYPDVVRFVLGNITLNILIQPTLPTEPYTSNAIVRFVTKVVAAGVVCGLGIICLYAFFRNTVRRKEDFKNKLNQKCLVEIPHVAFHRKSKEKNRKSFVRMSEKQPLFKEAYRLLRKRLERKLDKDSGNIIAVVAAAYSEGKSTVALNAAHAFAMAGKKSAVVDMDFQKRSFQNHIAEYKGDKGIIEAVSDGKIPFENIAVKNEDNLDIFYAGEGQLKITDTTFAEFFTFLRTNYDYVFVNTPAGRTASGLVSVCNNCDSILFVVKQDSLSLEKIKKTLEILSFSTAKFLGFVFNGVQEGFSGYGGYYYGGKYGYGKYSYGRYGYGKYGYGRSYGRYGYGHYGGYGYGYGYGYGDEPDDGGSHKKSKRSKGDSSKTEEIGDLDIPDNS